MNAPTAGSDRGSRTGLFVGLALAAAVAGALIASMATRDEPADRQITEIGFAETTGGVLPPMPPSGADPAVGIVAPTIRAMTFDDTQVDVVPGGGRALVIGFFAHWCPHCQAELPRLTEWLNLKDPPEGVEIVAVSTSVDSGAPNYPPSAWFKEVGWPELLLRDSATNAIGAGYGLTGFPYFVVIGPEGRVLRRMSGELSTQEWEYLLGLAATP